MEAIGGFPERISLGAKTDQQTFAKVGMDRTVVESQLQTQESCLEAMFDGADEGAIAEDEEQLEELPTPEVVDCIDPFLVSLNEQNLEPKQYAWKLKEQHDLNPQQTLAVAPVVQVVQQMYEGRPNQASHIADGTPAEPCRCLWLGAGGEWQDLQLHTGVAATPPTLLRRAGVCGSSTHTCCRTPARLGSSHHAEVGRRESAEQIGP